MYTINCRGKILTLDVPLVMGVINVTPDSFYKGDLNLGTDALAVMAGTMINDGADIIDLGGQSTRPGSIPLPAAAEAQRVIPVIKAITAKHPGIILSIDTYYSSVAVAAVEAGASIVNDISGGNADPDMLSTVAALKVPYICMHMKGTPATMHQEASYDNVVKEVLDFFIARLEDCRNAGINDVIIDPGFGFGKSIEQNFSLLKDLQVFSILNRPLLAGLSRKRTVYKTLGISPEQALNGTTVLNTIALLNGASIIRVHDVKAAREVVTLCTACKKAPH